ncbi:unnamed protein product (macronuclear) [Paramecium tetraurelia]|uniref:Uncharacterized protein n=1 Tax=Paramecium tetraurelia TaxID=5888 RepID=A0DZM5_PARTE|nr:uncharacterized protein GSPATT00021660001 [Paramecium tetraurelia]CAK88492.1 unnamed protein product [Paramecium tetraurelia]|eukprot:XP_001455889.1 hypothetical protein (macronuclear) [Paramecium tetraurelia strain d4-2]
MVRQNQILCKLLNQQGLIALQKQNYEQCIEYLRKAEVATIYVPELKVQTFNNLACYYRKMGKTRTALQYLQQALAIELQQKQSTSLPDIYLNLCAVLSQLERHDEAIQHIYLSIIMLQHELLISTFQKPELKQDQPNEQSFPSRQSSVQYVNTVKSHYNESKKVQERMSILVVAYHNLGVEMEHLKLQFESKKIFQSALQLSEQCLPQEHQLRHALEDITKKYNSEQQQQQGNEQLTLKPLLPKVHQKNSELKQIYKSVSPKQILRRSTQLQQQKINTNNKNFKFIKKNSFSETYRLERDRIMSINATTEVIIKNQENKDISNLPYLRTAIDTVNQTTIF